MDEIEFGATVAAQEEYEMQPTKQCRRCGIVKLASEMKRDTRSGDGYSSFCKRCHQAASVAWQQANPERVNETRRKRYHANKERINATRRETYDRDATRWQNLRRLYGVTREWYE